MPYREDEDALLARNDALTQQVADLTAQLAEARAGGRVVVTRTPIWAWIAAGLAAGASAIALLAMTTHAIAPDCPVAPEAAPVAAIPPDAAPEPPPPTPREVADGRLRYLLDTVDRDLRMFVAGYPAKLPAHAAGTRLGMPRGWIDDDIVDEDLAAAQGLAPTPAIAAALVPYLDHLQHWLPRWREVARYFSIGDYLDDDLATLRGEDADLRASFARFRTLSDALRAAVDAASGEDLASLPKGSDRQVYLAAWDACRHAVNLVLDKEVSLAAILDRPVTDCRAAIDAVRARNITDDYTLGVFDHLYGMTASVRRGDKIDPDGLGQLAIYLAQQVREQERSLSTAEPR